MPAILVLPQLSHPVLEMNTCEHGEREAEGTPPDHHLRLGLPSPGKSVSPLIGVDFAASRPGVIPSAACDG